MHRLAADYHYSSSDWGFFEVEGRQGVTKYRNGYFNVRSLERVALWVS